MRRADHILLGLASITALMLAGCAAVERRNTNTNTQSVTEVAYTCVAQSDGGEVEPGETITVTRGPDGECDGLTLGSVQTFELRSVHAADVVKAVTEVAVAEDGSFTFEVQVPFELRLGRAMVQAIPATPECADPETLDCPAPTVSLDVRHPVSALRDVQVVSTGLVTPPLPAHALEKWSHPYYLPGPADGQLTLVLPGSGCETFPRSFVVDAPSISFEIVSEVRGDGCADIATRWTSVIEVPDEFATFESVKVDNVSAEPLPGS